ncbi:hypothetical protein J8M20_09160 [Pseudoalteromonas luteoviolacea]|uniref:hypothetical protein n=1 Tax=Pseudoalteromonas luteoviolacea TaxID=43657 RepID=UPI001B371E03|nr:hypothetical protein [Pseudoalteromonas luteoviolacea]MBQ4811506.1 hypothetical protein [Pseudoalteromonas luteoviolacea]
MSTYYEIDEPEDSAQLYELKDGRFQIVGPGVLYDILLVSGYILVSERFAVFLDNLKISGIRLESAVIYNPANKKEIYTHQKMEVLKKYNKKNMNQIIDSTICKIAQYGNGCIFVNAPLKTEIEKVYKDYIFHHEFSYYAE